MGSDAREGLSEGADRQSPFPSRRPTLRRKGPATSSRDTEALETMLQAPSTQEGSPHRMSTLPRVPEELLRIPIVRGGSGLPRFSGT